MTRRFLVCLSLVALVLVVPATAGKPQPLSFQVQSIALQDPVRQQSPNYELCRLGLDECHLETWVHNPTHCVWSVDDDAYQVGGFGYLDAGSVASGIVCIISDSSGYLHAAVVDVTADTDELSVTIQDSFGNQWSIPSTSILGGFRYWGCVVLDPQFPSYPIIEGSNGGTGHEVSYVATVTNPTGHRVRDVRAALAARTNLLLFGCTYYFEP